MVPNLIRLPLMTGTMNALPAPSVQRHGRIKDQNMNWTSEVTTEYYERPDDYLLNVDELSAYLRINRDKAYELVREGSIPSVQIGRQWRIPVYVVRRWVAQQAKVEMPERAEVVNGGLRH
jgi:excisionase family DNA binding protein